MTLTASNLQQTLERLLLEREVEQFLYMEAELLDDAQAAGRPTIVQFDTASFSLIARDGRKGVRIKDRNAATRTTAGSIRTTAFPLPTTTTPSTWAFRRCG